MSIIDEIQKQCDALQDLPAPADRIALAALFGKVLSKYGYIVLPKSYYRELRGRSIQADEEITDDDTAKTLSV